MEGCGGGGGGCCFCGSGGGSVEEEEEVVKRFGHVMASGCGGCDGGYLVVYIQLLSLSLSRRGIWQSSLFAYRRSASELGSEVRYVSSVPYCTSKTITSLGKALAALPLPACTAPYNADRYR